MRDMSNVIVRTVVAFIQYYIFNLYIYIHGVKRKRERTIIYYFNGKISNSLTSGTRVNLRLYHSVCAHTYAIPFDRFLYRAAANVRLSTVRRTRAFCVRIVAVAKCHRRRGTLETRD